MRMRGHSFLWRKHLIVPKLGLHFPHRNGKGADMGFPKIGFLLGVVVVVGGCVSVKRLPPPPDYEVLAEIQGIPDARFWGDAAPSDASERIAAMRRQLESDPSYHPGDRVDFLAISGGGQKGAFTAGLLAGWTAAGTRPQFRIVSGVSAGALIAPFAFLGPEYDADIKDMYTLFPTRKVLKKHYVRGLLSGDAVADNAPLRAIIKRYFTPVEMGKIAEEHDRGRRLFVGTTYLDAERPVIWDLGAIASSGAPGAYELMVDILLASSAIPGVFPPVYFEVERNGRSYDELHVDGGVTRQSFILPAAFRLKDAMHLAKMNGPARIFLVSNARLRPEGQPVKPTSIHILRQSISTLLRAQGFIDMTQIQLDSQLEGIAFQAAFIPADFSAEPDELFDPVYMRSLYDLAYRKALSGYPWSDGFSKSPLPEE